MYKKIKWLFLFVLVFFNVFLTVNATEMTYSFPFDETRDISKPFLSQEPKKWLILDADLNTDVDDVCAVRMATTLDDLGVIDLKAICYCVDNSDLEALRGLLVHDGKEDVLIGQGTEDRIEESPYWHILRKYSDKGGLRDTSVRQYRKILEEATTPVDIVTIGYLTNLEALLKSEPDDISDKTGKQLVLEKVGQLYIAGGEYPNGWSNNLAFSNVDRLATKYVIENWGLPIIFSPGNHSGRLVCGKYLQELDVNRLDPVSKSLSAFGTEVGRTAWDPFLVWVAGYGCRDLNQISFTQCSIDIDIESGNNVYTKDNNGLIYAIDLTNPDLNYYNQVLDNHLIYGLTKKYGIENPNKHPIGIENVKSIEIVEEENKELIEKEDKDEDKYKGKDKLSNDCNCNFSQRCDIYKIRQNLQKSYFVDKTINCKIHKYIFCKKYKLLY